MSWKRHLSFFALALIVSALAVMAMPLLLTRWTVTFSYPVTATAADVMWWRSVTEDSLDSGEQLMKQEAGGIGWSVTFLQAEISTACRQSVTRVRCGLPFACFEARIRRQPDGTVIRESIAEWRLGSITRRVPTHILPWRFAANVLILTAVLYGIDLGIDRIRRTWRTHRGRCAACGYSLDVLTRCPECGGASSPCGVHTRKSQC